MAKIAPPSTDSSKAARKVGQTMDEFRDGTLTDSAGKPITDRQQAVDAALTEARDTDTPEPPRKSGGK